MYNEFNGIIKDRYKKSKRRQNDLRVGKKNKKIANSEGFGFDKSDLYYKKGHIFGDEEREFCCKVTKSKYNGFNPKFSERKKYTDINSQLKEYEDTKNKVFVVMSCHGQDWEDAEINGVKYVEVYRSKDEQEAQFYIDCQLAPADFYIKEVTE